MAPKSGFGTPKFSHAISGKPVFLFFFPLDERAEENMQVLLNRLAVWGGWPIATENWDESKFDWKKLLVDLIHTNDLHPLLSIRILMDRMNRSIPVVTIDQVSYYTVKLLFLPLVLNLFVK